MTRCPVCMNADMKIASPSKAQQKAWSQEAIANGKFGHLGYNLEELKETVTGFQKLVLLLREDTTMQAHYDHFVFSVCEAQLRIADQKDHNVKLYIRDKEVRIEDLNREIDSCRH